MSPRSYRTSTSPPPRAQRERPRVASITLELDPDSLQLVSWRVDPGDFVLAQRLHARAHVIERILVALGRELDRELAA